MLWELEQGLLETLRGIAHRAIRYAACTGDRICAKRMERAELGIWKGDQLRDRGSTVLAVRAYALAYRNAVRR